MTTSNSIEGQKSMALIKENYYSTTEKVTNTLPNGETAVLLKSGKEIQYNT